MIPLLVNAPSLAIQRSQRSDAIIVESWWEKENFSVTSISSSKASLVNATDVMEISDDHIPSLRGWFLKEKRDKFKRHQSVFSGSTSSVRRWFTIERVSSSNDGNGDPLAELALCYYKRSSSDKQGRCGWLFLSDVLSLGQDVPNRWITIEHPTRVMRLQSPTPAQHRVWFSTLSKCCKHVRKDAMSPSSEPSSKDHMCPSLPYFSEDSVQKAKKNSLKSAQKPLPSTQKDELKFLREITGGRNKRSTEVMRKNLFCGSSSSSSDSSAAVPAQFLEGNELTNEKGTCEEEKENRPFVRNETSVDLRRPSYTQFGSFSTAQTAKTNQVFSSGVNGQSEATIATSHLKSEEKTEVVEPHGHARACHNNGGDLQLTSTKGHLKRRELKMSLFKRDDPQLNNHDEHASHHFATSSSFRLHFGNEDDGEVLADDNFLTDDWDT